MSPHYETDDTAFPSHAYGVSGFPGIAFYVRGWETVPDEDTEWSGIEERSGRVVVVMVGDDHKYCVDPEDVTPLRRSEYCGTCGQIGCGHNSPDDDE